MNSFGRLFRTHIVGESHGPATGIVVDGCPAGLDLCPDDFVSDLKRRRGGTEGTTPRVEDDVPRILSGLFEGRTTGAPILVLFDNTGQESGVYDAMRYTPRPGHADLAAFLKRGGFNDHRGGGHHSGRLSVGLVAAGVIAKKIIAPIAVEARLVEAGGMSDIDRAIGETDPDDSIGGIVELRARHIPAGLGEPFYDSLESLVSHGVFSIPAVKGIEFGSGFASARLCGSKANDEIIDRSGTTATNNAGGISGGISNGNELLFRAAVKPTPSIARTQGTIDMRDGRRVSLSVAGRHDRCIALRMPVIIEAVTAMVLADCLFMEQRVRRVWVEGTGAPAGGEGEERDRTTVPALDRLLYNAIAGIPESGLFDDRTVAQLESITSRLEHLKHIIRGRDGEELRLFLARIADAR